MPFYLADLLFYIQIISKENNKRDKSHFFRSMENNKIFNSILLSHQQAVIAIVF